MKIQIVSDLHLEFPDNRIWLEINPLIPCADILIIAGDTSSMNNPEVAMPFLEKISKQFSLILSTPGNHEFYGSNIELAYPSYRKQLAPHHYCLNNQVYLHENLRFICSVLWSRVMDTYRQDVETHLNDYRHIQRHQKGLGSTALRVNDTNSLFHQSLDFIKQELDKPFAGKTILLTHHLPSYQCVPKQFQSSRLTSGFASDLDELILANPQISYWFYGHAHDFHQVQIGETQLIRNPLGYVSQGEHQGFRRDYCVDV